VPRFQPRANYRREEIHDHGRTDLALGGIGRYAKNALDAQLLLGQLEE
jgi:hypothetical protein